MTLDGKIATASGESKWITGPQARAHGMALRRSVDAILVGVNTVLSDDPSLTLRSVAGFRRVPKQKVLRRIVLDSLARTPLSAKVVSDEHAGFTTIVVGPGAPQSRVRALARKVTVLIAPEYPAEPGCPPRLDLNWLMNTLGSQGVTSLLVEGGGEVNASFLLRGLAHRICFFYAPKILGGKTAKPAVGGAGARNWDEVLRLQNVRSRRVGSDLMLEADVAPLKS
jgi:diaminohydroxyphosphoribosylaminopyrimidine deaminase/5-amino-6-(5-phosphoribosylamino)uracil reductase